MCRNEQDNEVKEKSLTIEDLHSKLLSEVESVHQLSNQQTLSNQVNT